MDKVSQTINKVVQELYSADVDVLLERPLAEFGDYSTNVAMQMAGRLKRAPREIAQEIAEKLSEADFVKSVEIAGPGFINIKLNNQILIDLMSTETIKSRKDKVVVIETNNPNPFKAMHIGHAYNAILADTMANLLEVSGATVHRVSYHGDVGTHVGKSMWAIFNEVGDDISKIKQIPADERNKFMSKMYVAGAKAYKESVECKQQIDELAKQSFKLDDDKYREIYNLCAGWSYSEIDKIVARLGNVPIEKRYLESQTELPGKQLIIDNTPNIFTFSDGAYVFEGSKYGSFDNVYIGSRGNGLYGAHDMGLIQLKYSDYQDLDMSIVVTGNEQAGYFKGVISASELAIPELKGKLFNYPTGMVKLSTGKMSSRTGEVLEVDWLFREFANAIVDRGGEAKDEIIVGALRYQFLKSKIGGDVVFDIGEAVSLVGNTGSYLQYAHARAKRILSKLSTEPAEVTEVYDEDKALVRKMGEYSEVVNKASDNLEPHHLCTYLFELAQEFNRYYENYQVVGSDKESHRAGLVCQYAEVLKRGLNILGIHAPETM